MSSPIYPDQTDPSVRVTHDMPRASSPEHPPVSRDALVRLKILTPLAVLLSLVSNLVFALAVKPSMGRINDDFLTPLTPKKTMIGIYWLVLYVLMVGWAVYVVVVRSEHGKHLVVNGMGLRFVAVQFLFLLFPIFYFTSLFPVVFIILALITLLLLSIRFSLRLHPVSFKRPFSYFFAHVAVRMFFSVMWTVDLWVTGCLGLGWFKYVGSDADKSDRPGQWEKGHQGHLWIIFAILLSTSLLSSLVTFATKDLPTALSTIYLLIAILLGPTTSSDPAPQITVTVILCAVLQGVAVASGFGWSFWRSREEGKIRLEDGEEHGAHVAA